MQYRFQQNESPSSIATLWSVLISDDLRGRHNDIVWRIRWGPRWLYVYLLIEFQSTVNRFMAILSLTYIGLLYQDLANAKQFFDSNRLPPVLPIPP